MDQVAQLIIHEDRKLRSLFLDLNSYFASVEQQVNPELRGKPIIVVPVETDSSFAIAVSYEAKAFGIKTGTRIGDAKQMCPGLIVVHSVAPCYVHYHKLVLEAVEQVLPIDKVCSIDEMQFELIGQECEPENARKLALTMKEAVRDHAGVCLTSSIGIAPNNFLAKIGTELQKPDGLVTLELKDIPGPLLDLKLTDLPGINKGMRGRLHACGIFSIEQLYACNISEIRRAFGSLIGERWWYLLRGYHLEEQKTRTRSLGHSHVLAPEFRNVEGVKQVLLRLTTKACARLRFSGFVAGGMVVSVKGKVQSWSVTVALPDANDTPRIYDELLKAWELHDFSSPFACSISFYNLSKPGLFTPSLFEQEPITNGFSQAMDEINQKFGKNKIYLAGLHKAKSTADEKIAFQKTNLHSEGKNDHEWIDTFRGPKG